MNVCIGKSTALLLLSLGCLSPAFCFAVSYGVSDHRVSFSVTKNSCLQPTTARCEMKVSLGRYELSENESRVFSYESLQVAVQDGVRTFGGENIQGLLDAMGKNEVSCDHYDWLISSHQDDSDQNHSERINAYRWTTEFELNVYDLSFLDSPGEKYLNRLQNVFAAYDVDLVFYDNESGDGIILDRFGPVQTSLFRAEYMPSMMFGHKMVLLLAKNQFTDHPLLTQASGSFEDQDPFCRIEMEIDFQQVFSGILNDAKLKTKLSRQLTLPEENSEGHNSDEFFELYYSRK